MQMDDFMKLALTPQAMSGFVSVVTGALWFAVKRLIKDVRQSITGITILTTRLEEQEKARQLSDKLHNDKLEKMADRVQRIEVGFAVLEREFVKKKRDNGSGLNEYED